MRGEGWVLKTSKPSQPRSKKEHFKRISLFFLQHNDLTDCFNCCSAPAWTQRQVSTCCSSGSAASGAGVIPDIRWVWENAAVCCLIKARAADVCVKAGGLHRGQVLVAQRTHRQCPHWFPEGLCVLRRLLLRDGTTKKKKTKHWKYTVKSTLSLLSREGFQDVFSHQLRAFQQKQWMSFIACTGKFHVLKLLKSSGHAAHAFALNPTRVSNQSSFSPSCRLIWVFPRCVLEHLAEKIQAGETD